MALSKSDKEQIKNMITALTTPLPKGIRATVGLADYNKYFDTSGLGGNIYAGWAISNGNNGTTNRLGKFCVYFDPNDAQLNLPAKTGGAKTVTLVEANLPAHTHTYALIEHSHGITDNGHTHVATVSTALTGNTNISAEGAGTYAVNFSTNSIPLKYQTIELANSEVDVHQVEAYVRDIDLQSGATTPTSGTENKAVTVTGTANVSDHTHTPLTLSHNHTVTNGTVTTGVTVNNSSAASGNTGSVGSGTSFSILPPFIVEVPIEKIV